MASALVLRPESRRFEAKRLYSSLSLSVQVYVWALGKNAAVSLRLSSIPSRKSSNTSSFFKLQKPGEVRVVWVTCGSCAT